MSFSKLIKSICFLFPDLVHVIYFIIDYINLARRLQINNLLIAPRLIFFTYSDGNDLIIGFLVLYFC